MAPDFSVERQFRFQCSCGATTESGEKTVICSGCGNTLGIRRVRRRRQRGNTVAYYGKTLRVRRVEKHRSRFGKWLKSALPGSVKGILRDVHDEPGGEPKINELPRRPPLIEGAHVRVGPTRPDGKPHPHAGKTGRITKFSYAYPDWHVPPCAAVKLDSGIWPRGFIWVSLQCLEVLPENPRDTNL
jgi:hypothetical protein